MEDAKYKTKPWRRWEPYLSEGQCQWELFMKTIPLMGNYWNYLPHNHARSHAYRCLSLVWNEKDEMLKERLFGLTRDEGNHGEDVKERVLLLSI